MRGRGERHQILESCQQLEPVLGRGRLLQDRAWRGRVRNRERRRRECQQRQMERAWCAGHVISELQHAKLWPLPAVRMQRRDVSTFTLFRMLIFRTFIFCFPYNVLTLSDITKTTSTTVTVWWVVHS